jgi:aminopeptidase N
VGYRNYMNAALWSPGFSGPIYNPFDLFSSTCTTRGVGQHMLRRVVGDANFFNTLRDWYIQHDNGNGDTAQYQALHEARYGGSLDWFFQEWVYEDGQPSYEYGWSTADLGNGTYRTYVRIRQTQASFGTFTMPVDLTLYPGGLPETHTVWNDQADQDFTFVTSAWPTGLNFDLDDWILKTGETAITLPDQDIDGVPDRNDNCTGTVNPTQVDSDLDGAAMLVIRTTTTTVWRMRATATRSIRSRERRGWSTAWRLPERAS